MVRAAIHQSIGLLVLALAFRTFLVSGIIEPIQVQGSSMAPGYWGASTRLACEQCGLSLRAGLEQAPPGAAVVCPGCGSLGLKSADSGPVRGDGLWIDRTSTSPRRFAPVVLRSPLDARRLFIKRVVGLPGELVELREGDVWINGGRCVKSLREQLDVRRCEHVEGQDSRRWRPEQGGCEYSEAAWSLRATQRGPAKLAYPRKITDIFPANLRATRRLNPQHDLMLEVDTSAAPDAVWTMSLPGARATVDCASRTVSLHTAGQTASAPFHGSLQQQVLLSVFDRRALLSTAGQPLLSLPIDNAPDAGPSLGVRTGEVRFGRIALWKDIYYEAHPSAQNLPQGAGWELGAREYFVIGDNQAVSLDSRNWGAGAGVSRRLLVGKPLN